MGIHLGNTVIKNMYKSDERIKSAYLGDELIFKIEKGVYIQDTNGLLYTKEKWNKSGKTANAIAVIDDKCRFIISLNYDHSGGDVQQWSPNGVADLLTGVTTTTDSTWMVHKDYKGYENTEYILGYYGTSSLYAARKCKSFTFPNGQNGYLASVGEWDIAYSNKAKIEECLSLVSAESIIISDRHWASTQYDNETTYIFAWKSGSSAAVGKKYGFQSRAFGQLPDNVTFA